MMPEDPPRKNVVVVLNGISLHKKVFYHKYFSRLRSLCNLEIFETLSRNDAISIASRAAEKYVDIVIAAGGDGTLNQVVNGMLRGRENETKLPAVGLIPIGTGNDFARTAGLHCDADQLMDLIKEFSPAKIDVGSIRYTPFSGSHADEEQRYFVNVADLGMGPMVVDKVLKSGRAWGHAAAYYKSIVSTFFTYKPMVVTASTSDWTWKGKLRSLAVANGRYYGHGLAIAPFAKLDDRMFSVFICGNVSVLDFILQTPALKKGKLITLRDVHYKKGVAVDFTSESPCMIEGDGEILGLLPARVELIERQIRFLLPKEKEVGKNPDLPIPAPEAELFL